MSSPYTKSYFRQINRQIGSALDSEGTYNTIAAYAVQNPAQRETTGGIARHIAQQRSDLIGMTSKEQENDPYKATAKFLTNAVTDVAVRIFDNTYNQLTTQGMNSYNAAVVAERMASQTAQGLVQPLFSGTVQEQTQGVDNLLGIMTKANTSTGKIEIDLDRISFDGKSKINDVLNLTIGEKDYKVQPIEGKSYTPFIAKNVDLGGEWYEAHKYLGALGSSTLIGQAVSGISELFGVEAAEWVAARREFERQVIGESGTWATVAYSGRDMVGVIGETAFIAAKLRIGMIPQTVIRSFMTEKMDEAGQLSMRYVTGDERQKANTAALMTNVLFDAVTMTLSVGAGKLFSSAYNAGFASKYMPDAIRKSATAT